MPSHNAEPMLGAEGWRDESDVEVYKFCILAVLLDRDPRACIEAAGLNSHKSGRDRPSWIGRAISEMAERAQDADLIDTFAAEVNPVTMPYKRA